MLGSSVYCDGGIASSRLGSFGFWPMLVRRIATVTICAPLASTAARVSAKSWYLPVPTSRRDAYGLPAMTSGSRFSWGFMMSDWLRSGRMTVCAAGLHGAMAHVKRVQPPPTATTISSLSPSRIDVAENALRGTISPLRSMAMRLPASPSESMSWVKASGSTNSWCSPLTVTLIIRVRRRLKVDGGCAAQRS